ncbi:MAG: tRNA(fMet)-specific endonuclease VapC, partial [Spirosomataceae bacterium]
VNKFINGLTVILIHSIVNAYAKEKVRLRKIGKPMHDEFDNWSNSFGEQIDFSH